MVQAFFLMDALAVEAMRKAIRHRLVVEFIGCLLLLFFLDYQGDIRATRTRAERLVSDESETETRIRIETILSGQTLCNPIKGFLFLLQEAL